MSTITVELTKEDLEKEANQTFGPGNLEWSGKNPDYNFHFLRAQQAYCNDRLITQGYLFLNDVRTLLSLPISPLGAVLGWFKGDNVDFGINSIKFDEPIPLKFNVDKVIVNDI